MLLCASCRRAPTATFHDSKHNVVHVHFDATRGWLLTSGTDKVMKVRMQLTPTESTVILDRFNNLILFSPFEQLWDMTPVVS